MNSKLTKTMAIMAVAVMLFSAMTAVTVGTPSSDAADSMPSSYTVDSKYITPVRNQGTEGLCWAFGVSSTLESELILNGYYDNTTILSPLFTGVRQFDGYEKDYAGGDYNGLKKEGTMNVNGGSAIQLIEMLSNGKCPVEEYLAPYEEFRPDYDGADTTLTSLVLVKGIECYNPYTEAEEIKSMLLQNKTAIFMYHSGGDWSTMKVVDYGDNRYFTVNVVANEGVTSNHAVSLIGYDDDFPKENFVIQPKNDGAWLVKNSWGTNFVGEGDCGYYWVSYESLITQAIFLTEVEMNDGTQHIYSYDNGYTTRSNIYRTGKAVMANVFTAERDETITGASFSVIDNETVLYLEDLNQKYTVSVYKLIDNYSTPYDGRCVYTSDEGLVTQCGTTYVDIKNGLEVNKGDRFSVCVTFTGDSIVLPVDSKEDSLSSVYHIESKAGQSYTYSNGKWIDISADGMSNFRIKAYTSSDKGDVASVNGITYATIQDAVDKAKSGDTVYLLRTVEISDAIEITGKDITLDLRGYHLECPSDIAVKIKDSKATVQYGRIIAPVCIETDNSKVDVKRCYLQPTYECVTAVDESDVDLYRVKIDTSAEGTGITVEDSALTFTDCYQTDANESYVIVKTSDNGSATFNGGTYYGTVIGENIEAVSGTFMDLVPEISEGSLYDEARMQVFVPTIEYVDGVSGETVRTASLEVASTSSASAKLIANVDTSESICTAEGSAFTLDLNGYDLTTSDNLLANASSVSIVNGQSDWSSLKCRTLGVLERDVTVGENVSVRMTSDVATTYTGTYSLNLSIAEGSSMVYSTDTGSSSADYEPYSSDGKLYVKVTTEYKDESGNVTATAKEIRAYQFITALTGQSKFTYTSEKTYIDGTAEKVTGDTLQNSGLDLIYTKTTEKGGKVLYEEQYYDINAGAAQSVEAVKGGVCNISISISAQMNTTAIEKENVEKAIKSLNEKKNSDTIKNLGCSEINLSAAIANYSVNQRVLTPEISKLLIDGGVGIIISAYSSVAASAATIKEIGERTISVYTSEISSDDVTAEQERTLAGFRVVRNFNLEVDGKDYTEKLENPVELVLCIPNVNADSKVYQVNKDGSLTQIKCEYLISNGIDALKFSASSAGVYAVDVSPSPEDQSDNTAIVTITAVIAAIVVILALAVLLVRRGQ